MAGMSEPAANPFNPRLVIGLVSLSLIAFVALVLLLAFGANLGTGRDGRAHALSVSAVGYKGLVDLVGRFHDVSMIERSAQLDTGGLVVVALEPQSRQEALTSLLATRADRATIIILPKWVTRPLPARRGWVEALEPDAGPAVAPLFQGRLSVGETRSLPAGTRAAGQDFLEGFSLPVPQSPQVVSGETLTPLVTLPDGGILVARLGTQPHYIIADPDLVNNHGLHDQAAARAALDLIEALGPNPRGPVAFDVTMNGLGARTAPSLLRTAFEPPFLVMTLALFFAALLAGLHGAIRFGQARRESRAIAFGKAALVENSAGLIKLARREARLGGAYVDVVRQGAARTASAPTWLSGDKLDAYLDRLSRSGEPSFSELARRVAYASDRHELVAAARALFSWKKDIIR
jgi:hypothetical protein